MIACISTELQLARQFLFNNFQLQIVTPYEGKSPNPVFNDELCEELPHPHLFPKERFGYKAKCQVPITPSKYFNQRLLNYEQGFVSDSGYIFFAHSVLQRTQLNEQINIATRKVATGSSISGMLSKNFKAPIKEFIVSDKAYIFIRLVKGKSALGKNQIFLN